MAAQEPKCGPWTIHEKSQSRVGLELDGTQFGQVDDQRLRNAKDRWFVIGRDATKLIDVILQRGC